MNKTLVRVLVVVGALVVLRLVVPPAIALAHYRGTPTFREWARAHPVPDELWRARVPAGAEVAAALPWSASSGAPTGRVGQWRPQVVFTHGDEVLLDLELEVAVESRHVESDPESGVPSEAFEGLAARSLRAELDPDFHAVVVLSVADLSAHLLALEGERRQQGPDVRLDVFVLSGPGEVRFLVQDVPAELEDAAAPPFPTVAQALGRTLGLAALLGVLHPTDDPPEEGLAYHARAGFAPSWKALVGGHQGGSIRPWSYGAASAQYSIRIAGEQSVRAPHDEPGHFVIRRSSHQEARYTWNSEVW